MVAEEKSEAEKFANLRDISSPTSSSPSEDGDSGEKTIVNFTREDKTNPYNWSRPKKLYVVITGMLMVLNSTMGSALPAGATAAIQKYWDVQNEELLVLPVSIYLIGYILGPLIFAPLSE